MPRSTEAVVATKTLYINFSINLSHLYVGHHCEKVAIEDHFTLNMIDKSCVHLGLRTLSIIIFQIPPALTPPAHVIVL